MARVCSEVNTPTTAAKTVKIGTSPHHKPSTYSDTQEIIRQPENLLAVEVNDRE